MFEFDPWALAVPTVLIGTFGVAVARSRSQWSISLRVAGGARISKGAPRVCPHLGMADDVGKGLHHRQLEPGRLVGRKPPRGPAGKSPGPRDIAKALLEVQRLDREQRLTG